jgi:hypothetical protein
VTATLAELDQAERAELARLRERRSLTTAQYRAERSRIGHHYAGERDKLIRQNLPSPGATSGFAGRVVARQIPKDFGNFR